MANPSAPPAIVGTPDSETHRNAVLAQEGNPFSIVNLVPKEIGALIDEHLFTHPHLFNRDEKSLKKELGLIKKGNELESSEKSGIDVSVTDNRLRIAFWMEYDRAMEAATKMNMVRVFGGVCLGQHFMHNVMSNPHKVAWILCPPTSYSAQMQEALHFGIERLREILDADIIDKRTGKVDAKIGELILKIVDKLDVRVKGAVVQRLETKALHVNVNKQMPASGAEDMATLEAKIAELEKRALGDKPSVAIMPDEVLDAEVVKP